MNRLITAVILSIALLITGASITPSFTFSVAHADGGGGSE